MQNQPAVRIVRKFALPINSVFRPDVTDSDEEEQLAYEAEFNPTGLLLKEVKNFPDGDASEIHVYLYDDKGRLLEHHLDIPADGISERFITVRNADGNPVCITKFYGEDKGEHTDYTFGTHAQPVKIVQFDADGELEQTEELEFDDKARMILRKTIHANGDPTKILSFTYNDHGWMMSQIETNDSGKQVSRLVFEYDDEGRELKTKQYNAEDKFSAEITSVYDDNGRLIRKTSRGFYTRISQYEYDEQGNLKEESLSDENGFVISRNRFAYDEGNRLAEETVYETDLTRSGRDTHFSHRYEYEFH
ncbi:hypothetical protein BH11BAC2_BH11BAC2_25740 [soil metagenome]